MFKIGDKLKVIESVAEEHYDGCKHTTVYENMMKQARERRFEVVGDTGFEYILKRDDGEQIQTTKDEVHSYFQLAKD